MELGDSRCDHTIRLAFFSIVLNNSIVEEKACSHQTPDVAGRFAPCAALGVASGWSNGCWSPATSIADEIIATFAMEYKAAPLHKDPEFEVLTGYVKLEALPYKAKKNRFRVYSAAHPLWTGCEVRAS